MRNHDATERNHRDVGRAADIHYHAAEGPSIGSPAPIAAAIGSSTISTSRAGELRRVLNRALLDARDFAGTQMVTCAG